jgi:DNA polymerase
VKLFLDTETYSEVPLHAGLAKYATQAEVMIVTWAVDEGDVHCWDATHHAEIPPALLIAAEQCDQVIAHNSQFDRTIAGVDKRFPKLARLLAGKWYCTMGQALRHGLPGGLDKLCTIFKIDAKQAKIDGKKYIHLFCKPNKDGTRNTRLTHPQEWREFLKYATLDISAMREVHRKLPRWNDTAHELALWDLDQTINARPVPCARPKPNRNDWRIARNSSRTAATKTANLNCGRPSAIGCSRSCWSSTASPCPT